MSQYIYKCVNVPEVISIGRGQTHSSVADAYASIINEAAKDNWEYVGVDEVHSDFTPGFIMSLLCKIPIINLFIRCSEGAKLKVIVFKKQQ